MPQAPNGELDAKLRKTRPRDMKRREPCPAAHAACLFEFSVVQQSRDKNDET